MPVQNTVISAGTPAAARYVLRTLVLLLAFLAAAAPAAARREKETAVEGTLATIEATKITVHPAQGADVTLVCREDFRETVAPGSQVTAYYVVKEGTPTLTFLEYPPQSFFAPPEEIRKSMSKIIIVPNYGVANSEILVDKIADYLSQNLGWYVAPAMLGNEIALRVKRAHSTLEDIDPQTGEFKMEQLTRLQHKVIQREISEARVQGVLEVGVIQVQAAVINNYASWDGVEEDIAGKAVRGLATLTRFPQNGEVPAATVAMKLWNSQGKVLWSCRRGFAALVLHVGMGNDFKDRPLTEVYQGEAGVNQWLAETLGTWAPPRTPATPAPAETPVAEKKGKSAN